jgi:syntaxin-binding protein 1
MDAIYFLAPKPHIVECLVADFQRDCYKRGYLVWVGVLGRELQVKVGTISRHKIAGTKLPIPNCHLFTYTGAAVWETLLIDYFPRESHVVTFRDPWSFPILFHPACNEMVKKHLEELAHKVRKTASRYRTAGAPTR